MAAFFDKMSNQWRDDQNHCLREIEWHQDANECYMDEGVQLLELAWNAQRLFAKQEPREKWLADFCTAVLHLGESCHHLPSTL